MLILRENPQGPMMKEKQNCFIFLKNQFPFFYSPSTGSRNATPIATRKRDSPVVRTPPVDKLFSVKVKLDEMQGRKIDTQVFVNLKHYVKFNCNVFTFKKNLVLWLSNIHRLLDLKTSLFFVIFCNLWKQIIVPLGISYEVSLFSINNRDCIFKYFKSRFSFQVIIFECDTSK